MDVLITVHDGEIAKWIQEETIPISGAVPLKLDE